MDIETAITLQSPRTMHQILLKAGPAASEPYRITPLDFVSREEWDATLLWKYCVEILRRMHAIHSYPKSRPAQHISSFTFPKSSSHLLMIPLLVGGVYGAIFLSAWNFYFPSEVEQLLWRICSSTLMALVVIAGICEKLVNTTQKDTEDDLTYTSSKRFAKSTSKDSGILANRYHNNSPTKDPHLYVPIRSLLLGLPFMALYCICRAILLLEDVISLRELPASTFKNVSWTQFLPHF